MKIAKRFNFIPKTYNQRKAFWGFIFVLPWLLGFIAFFLVPLLNSLRYSFSSIEATANGMSIKFIGLENYIQALTVNTSFNRTLVESIIDVLVNVPLIVIFSLFLAVLLNQRFFGRSLARAIFFLPVILASGVIFSLESTSLIQAVNEQNVGNSGAVNAFGSFELQKMMLEAGVSKTIVLYLTGAVDRIYEIISMSGVQILIFLAGIQTISPQLYEASKIEGATGYEAFWKITFPMVSPLILVNLVYTVIDSFSRNNLTTLIRETGFKSFNFGLGSAMAWIYFLCISIILVISSYIISKRVFYYE
ncbi:carbohydrate ABC transporter permease [Lederbergia galactosidilytica]|uniref:ABC transporter permease n=1 Tax=Lederbergia galactosidilytica TaxID=217031 RepID=A0A0Q9Y862_9BACI|nr:sugar ABC transporter permease [Lederbergia galactosidilytica]KRG09335.1 ABC transporter permease [Virgibacillus soli]KRG11747.1 ABC transporter permease [Lederbergia galactosidilytica]MBP1913441.1 ABC-type sugar transport system permease subunit [Lederbergia galactosidilytica]OAK71387.1 ABC transporter permease [Lederbergia galactosidilytica]